MAREPLRLTYDVLTAHRPGALVAVAVGAPAGIPRQRPKGYKLRGGAFALHDTAVEPVAGGVPRMAAPLTAIVEVRGVLEQRASWSDCGETCGYDELEARVLDALADPGVGQVVLDVDSPGGDVPGLEQAVARMRAAVLASGKPCLAYVNEFAASAALWLVLCVCDGTYLPPSGRMGAVGSCVVFRTDARRLAEQGTDIYVGREPAGKYKPNDVEALDEVGKARIDRLALEGAERFYAAISAARGIPAETLRAWNGDTFTGAAAVDAGLADGIGSLEDVIALAETWPRAEAA